MADFLSHLGKWVKLIKFEAEMSVSALGRLKNHNVPYIHPNSTMFVPMNNYQGGINPWADSPQQQLIHTLKQDGGHLETRMICFSIHVSVRVLGRATMRMHKVTKGRCL